MAAGTENQQLLRVHHYPLHLAVLAWLRYSVDPIVPFHVALCAGRQRRHARGAYVYGGVAGRSERIGVFSVRESGCVLRVPDGAGHTVLCTDLATEDEDHGGDAEFNGDYVRAVLDTVMLYLCADQVG